jgi:hypothetical protein
MDQGLLGERSCGGRVRLIICGDYVLNADELTSSELVQPDVVHLWFGPHRVSYEGPEAQALIQFLANAHPQTLKLSKGTLTGVE